MDIKDEIEKEIRNVIEMIKKRNNRIEIEEQRKKLDDLLQKYLKEL